MKIANPIYDAVFKYMMEDTEVATDLLSLILGEEIVFLELMPQEIVAESEQGIRVFRIDFKAIVRTQTGVFKTILIEIQKAKRQSDFEIVRFRRYLAENYLKQEIVPQLDGSQEKMNLPIAAIYFLGFRLKNVPIPVLKVQRIYTNLTTSKALRKQVKEDFIEQLSHDLYAIQIPRLKMTLQTDLEKMLDVFSQKKYKTADKHILEYLGDASDPRIARLLARLNRATLDDEVRRILWAEEEADMEYFALKKKADDADRAKEEAISAKEEAISAKEEERKAKEVAQARADFLEKQIAMMIEKMNPKD